MYSITIFCAYFFISFASLIPATLSWHNSIKFDSIVDNISNYSLDLFESSYKGRDYFSLISSNRNNHMDENTGKVFLGGRNNLYHLSLPDLKLIDKITWESSNFNVMKCLNRSIIRNKDECANYIRLFLKLDDETFRICSTNALNPKCRFYQSKAEPKNSIVNLSQAIVLNETSGLGYSPLKAHESKHAYNLVEANSHLYTANTIDLNRYFTSIDRTIEQEKVATNVDDINWLNRADFINTFNNDKRIFFVFNEEAVVESSILSINNRPIKRNVASISQICLNDPGAPLNSVRNIWTTFLKSRLNCVYDPSKLDDGYFDNSFKFTGNSKLFYFNEIKSMSKLFTNKIPGSNETTTYFYAVFTTSKYAVTASAICKFNMEQIMESFHGNYKRSTTEVPNPRPSECPNKLTYQHLKFSRKHILMEQEIRSNALIVETSQTNRFESIDVDFKVNSFNNEIKNDILFVGTDDGNLLTFVTNPKTEKIVFSEKLNVFSHGKLNSVNITESLENSIVQKSIKNIKLFGNSPNKTLLIITKNKLITLPANKCSVKSTPEKCDNLVNPYCIWSHLNSECVNFHKDYQEIATTKFTIETTTEQDYVIKKSASNLSNDTLAFEPIIEKSFKSSETFKSELKSSRDEINFSMDLISFLSVIFGFVTISFMFGSILTIIIIKKYNKDGRLFFKKCLFGALVEDSFKQPDEKSDKFDELYSKVQPKNRQNVIKEDEQDNSLITPGSGGSSNYSIISECVASAYTEQHDPRYVSVDSTDTHVGHIDLPLNSMQYSNSRFLDYDDTEYFTIKKKRTEQGINFNSIGSGSCSSSSTTSGQTLNSRVLLMKQTIPLPQTRPYIGSIYADIPKKYYV